MHTVNDAVEQAKAEEFSRVKSARDHLITAFFLRDSGRPDEAERELDAAYEELNERLDALYLAGADA